MNMNEMKDLTLEEEELACGGTVQEYSELERAYFDSQDLKDAINNVCHVPIANTLSVKVIEGCLKRKGIDADISLGLLGTGLFSSPNKYVRRDTKQSISHQEVLKIMKGA